MDNLFPSSKLRGKPAQEEVIEAWGSGINTDISGQSFRSTLLPSKTGNPGSGTVMVTGQMTHVVLTGTLPNHTFQIELCGVFGSCGEVIGNITTNSQRNVAADVPLTRFGVEGFFGLTRQRRYRVPRDVSRAVKRRIVS